MDNKEMNCENGVCELNKEQEINETECACGGECKCGGNCSCEDVDYGESEEVLILKNNIENLENKIKQTQAELINYRKRKDEEVTNKLKFANQDLIMEIIPVLDNFERAVNFSKADDEATTKFLNGFKMIYTTLSETLKKYGVEEIDCLGKEFDPNLHEAMLVDCDKEKENNIITEVLIKGYTLKGRILRAASVKVNKID